MSSSRSLSGVETVESELERRRLEDIGSVAAESFARSGGACQAIIVIERAENGQGNDTGSSWNRVSREAGASEDRLPARGHWVPVMNAAALDCNSHAIRAKGDADASPKAG